MPNLVIGVEVGGISGAQASLTLNCFTDAIGVSAEALVDLASSAQQINNAITARAQAAISEKSVAMGLGAVTFLPQDMVRIFGGAV